MQELTWRLAEICLEYGSLLGWFAFPDKQIPKIDSNQNAILLSAGGNDAELLNILNQCIYQWAVINSVQVAVAKAAALDKHFEWAADYNWDALGRGCEKQLDHSQSIIESAAFSSSLDALLSATKSKLAKDGMIYYTGYAKFWDEGMTAACDSVSWSTWIYKAYNIFQPQQKLTVAHRNKMNDLVDAMNSKPPLTLDTFQADAAKRAGSSVKFVNYDTYVGYFDGRYCEPGVDESTSESNTRVRLMFYELNTWDPLGNSPWKRNVDEALNGTFAGDQEVFAQITLLMDPKAGYSLKLRDDLSADKVVFAGTEVTVGSMNDGYFAGWSGKTIKFISDHIRPSLQHRPNIILLHAGTNDMNPNGAISTDGNDPQGAANRLGDLIDQMIAEYPDAVILVAMIIHTCDPNQSERTKQFQQLVPYVIKKRMQVITFSRSKADYLWIDPKNGEVKCWINNLPNPWSPAGTNNSIIASGAAPGKRVFIADMNADAMADYLVVDPSKGSVRVWWNYGPDANWVNGWKYVDGGVIASGVPHANLETLRLPDINGDGRADYVYIGQGGTLHHFMNTGSVGGTDVVFLDQGGIATGAAPDMKKLVLADVRFMPDGRDGLDDYLILDPKTGELKVYLSQGGGTSEWAWAFKYIGSIASGLGPGANVRFADIDGDGKDDYIYLHPNGRTTVYRNDYARDKPGPYWTPLPAADAIGIHQHAEEISFHDINHDGRADYVWTSAIDSSVYVWLNNYPNLPAWLPQGKIATGVGTSGSNIKWASPTESGFPDYIAFDPVDGRFAAWLNICPDGKSGPGPRIKADTSQHAA